MRNTLPEYVGRGYAYHDCASIIDSIAKKTSCSHCFSHDASLHHHSFIFTLVSCIFSRILCSCSHAQIYGAAPCHHVLSAVKMASCLVACRIQFSVAGLVVTAVPALIL